MAAEDELLDFIHQCLEVMSEKVSLEVGYCLTPLQIELGVPLAAVADAPLPDGVVDAGRFIVRSTLMEEEMGHTLALAVLTKIKQLGAGDAAEEGRLWEWFKNLPQPMTPEQLAAAAVDQDSSSV